LNAVGFGKPIFESGFQVQKLCQKWQVRAKKPRTS
jgi:hypothetical protein